LNIAGVLPAVVDLGHTSQGIHQLIEYEGTETGSTFIAVRGGLFESEYIGGPWVMFDREHAVYNGEVMVYNGYEAIFAGNWLFNVGVVSDHWGMIAAGGAIMDLGYIEVGYASFWNGALVGGYPNDGVVPAARATWTRANPTYDFTGVLHMEETKSNLSALRGFLTLHFR
jgi:hypothetical protein